MPELPEVETIKNELSPWVIGQRFTQVSISDTKLVQSSVEEFRCSLLGQRVESLERRGKYLIFRLSGNQSLIIHLRMTGALLLNPGESDYYARAAFKFSNDTRLVFNDRRRLGLMWLGDARAVDIKLGPEPLDDSFTSTVLEWNLSGHHIPVKAALIDQSIIAGIGNMYADEALFAAHIHPLRSSDSLSVEEIQTLYRCIREVLWAAIDNKGASVDTYIRPNGQLGTAHFVFKVAHKRSEPCPICGTPIERISVRNRGSYFCPECQPLTT